MKTNTACDDRHKDGNDAAASQRMLNTANKSAEEAFRWTVAWFLDL
jgi:hypothetical protein